MVKVRSRNFVFRNLEQEFSPLPIVPWTIPLMKDSPLTLHTIAAPGEMT